MEVKQSPIPPQETVGSITSSGVTGLASNNSMILCTRFPRVLCGGTWKSTPSSPQVSIWGLAAAGTAAVHTRGGNWIDSIEGMCMHIASGKSSGKASGNMSLTTLNGIKEEFSVWMYMGCQGQKVVLCHSVSGFPHNFRVWRRCHASTLYTSTKTIIYLLNLFEEK